MRRCKLGEIADFKNGVNYTKGETKYKYLCVGVTNFQESPILQDFDAISTVTLDNQLTEDFLLQEGDILLVRSNGNKRLIGRSMLIFPKDKVMTYSGFCIRCRITSPTVESKYIFYYLQNALIRGLFAKNQQTNINNISQEVLNNIMVFLPNVEIQRKISNLLFFIDSKIALNNRVNATLEAMAKTIYDYWFVQFDFPDEKGRPYKTRGGKMVYNEELGREIPAGWEVLPLHDICTVISGYPFDSSLYDTDGDYHILTIKNIQNGYIVPQTDSNIHEIPNDIPAVDILKIGDILMSLTGNVGRVGILCGNNYLLNQRAAIVQPQFDNIKWFLYFMFRNSAICMQIQNISTGTSQKNVSPIDIGNIKIPYADRYMQNFNDTILSMVNTIIARTVESQKLAALRDWLLPMLMNGQVGFRKGKGK